ncbi:hypothetical protein MKW92_014355 [Papaver armeniacum]|nr:hypothetical protein MKW92_014355 [Papaver armeniacum]
MNSKNEVSTKKVSSKNSQVKSIAKVVYTPLKDLRFKQTQNKTIKVKVLKAWISESKKTGEVWSLEAHIIDEEVDKENIDLFRGKLLDGCVYSIQRVTLQAPTGGYRIVPYHYLMWLNKYANIQQTRSGCIDFSNKYSLSCLWSWYLEGKTTTNVIGRLHSMSNIVIKQVDEHDETKMGKTMKITLWGELATMIDDGILDSNENAAVIIIVTGTFVKERMGLIGLSTTQASRVFVNLDCEQVHQFRMRLGEETGEIEEIHLEQEKDPFEDKISLYEASQMLMDFENTDKEFFCEASIVRVNQGKDWYYIACKKCKKQVQKQNGQTTCPKCKKTLMGKYRITVRIKDNTEYADLTIFGFNVEKMFKISLTDEHVAYAERCEKMGEPEKATQVFDRLIEKSLDLSQNDQDNIEKQWTITWS